MSARIHFRGPVQYQLRVSAQLSESILEVSARRLLRGPRRPGWNWFVEVGTLLLKKQLLTAFEMRDVEKMRRYLDSVEISSPLLRAVNVIPIVEAKFRGSWFAAKGATDPPTVLFLHGGGYSFYPRSYSYFITLITLAAKSRTFVLDYRLAPEHRFPAQLEDALNAYRWLLESGTNPNKLVLAGDSAGGNLALVLLLAARDAGLPLPVLAIALSPPTEFPIERIGHPDSDWINHAMLAQWAAWYCDPAQYRDPLVSPVRANLCGLPPIYIQAGRSEILYPSIQIFADYARNQGADVVLETWEDMGHDFQMFGPDAPQSAEALRRIGEVIDHRIKDLQVRSRQTKEALSC